MAIANHPVTIDYHMHLGAYLMVKKLLFVTMLILCNQALKSQVTATSIDQSGSNVVDNWDKLTLLDQTVAQKRFSWRGVEKLPEAPLDIKLRCQINENGGVHSCGPPLDKKYQNPYWQIAARNVSNSQPIFIIFNSERKPSYIGPIALIEVRIDPMDAPKIDPEEVPLTPIGEFIIPLLNIDYPPSAIRNELEGRVVVRCLVESDLSLSCAVPPNYEMSVPAVFESVVVKKLMSVKIGSQTVSKQIAAGKRFQFALNFRLPTN